MIDASRDVVDTIMIKPCQGHGGGVKVEVEYEWKPRRCKACGMFGHDCELKKGETKAGAVWRPVEKSKLDLGDGVKGPFSIGENSKKEGERGEMNVGNTLLHEGNYDGEIQEVPCAEKVTSGKKEESQRAFNKEVDLTSGATRAGMEDTHGEKRRSDLPNGNCISKEVSQKAINEEEVLPSGAILASNAGADLPNGACISREVTPEIDNSQKACKKYEIAGKTISILFDEVEDEPMMKMVEEQQSAVKMASSESLLEDSGFTVVDKKKKKKKAKQVVKGKGRERRAPQRQNSQ